MKKIVPFLGACLLGVFLVVSSGCGVKGWPEPQGEQDAFSFVKVSFDRENDCLLLKAVIQGNADNLDHFALLLEQDGCVTCPFQPERRVVFSLFDDRVHMLGDTVQISYCGLDSEKPLRFRLLGINTLEKLPPADSGVLQ